MNKLYASIVLIACSLVESLQQNQLIASMSAELSTLKSAQIGSSAGLVQDIKFGAIASNFITVAIGDLQQSMEQHDLPQNIRTKISAIAFMQSTSFSGFTSIVTPSAISTTGYVLVQLYLINVLKCRYNTYTAWKRKSECGIRSIRSYARVGERNIGGIVLKGM